MVTVIHRVGPMFSVFLCESAMTRASHRPKNDKRSILSINVDIVTGKHYRRCTWSLAVNTTVDIAIDSITVGTVGTVAIVTGSIAVDIVTGSIAVDVVSGNSTVDVVTGRLLLPQHGGVTPPPPPFRSVTQRLEPYLTLMACRRSLPCP